MCHIAEHLKAIRPVVDEKTRSIRLNPNPPLPPSTTDPNPGRRYLVHRSQTDASGAPCFSEIRGFLREPFDSSLTSPGGTVVGRHPRDEFHNNCTGKRNNTGGISSSSSLSERGFHLAEDGRGSRPVPICADALPHTARLAFSVLVLKQQLSPNRLRARAS